MANDYNAVTDGTYTLMESDNPNQYYFFRNDKQVLTDVDREPMDLYQALIMKKMMDGEITGMVMNNICYETSDDGTTIRLTVSDIGEVPVSHTSPTASKKPSFWKRLFQRLLG